MTKENKKIEKGSQEYKEAVEQQFQDVCVIMNLKVPKDYIPNRSNVECYIQEAFDNRCSDCGYINPEFEGPSDGHVYNDFVITNMNDKKSIDKIVKSFEDDKSWIDRTNFTIINVTHKEAIEKLLKFVFESIDASKGKGITIKLAVLAVEAGFDMQKIVDGKPIKDSSKYIPDRVYLEVKYVLFHAGIACEYGEITKNGEPVIHMRRKVEEDELPGIYIDDECTGDTIIFVES